MTFVKDVVLPGDLAEIGGKGLFTQELERGLLDGSLDLAVHSLKDLPVRLPEGLVVAAHPERGDPRDVLVRVFFFGALAFFSVRSIRRTFEM